MPVPKSPSVDEIFRPKYVNYSTNSHRNITMAPIYIYIYMHIYKHHVYVYVCLSYVRTCNLKEMISMEITSEIDYPAPKEKIFYLKKIK